MAQLITLDYYQAADRQYHAHQATGSTVDGQVHYHDYFQVCYVAQGKILHFREQDSVELEAGDAFIIPPGFPHSMHLVSADTRFLSLVFRESLFHEGFKLSSIASFLADLQRDGMKSQVQLRIRLNPRQQSNVQTLLDMLITEQAAGYLPALCAAPSLISSVLYMLAQGYYSEANNLCGPRKSVGYSDAMLRCTDYIDHNFTQPLTLDGLARQFGISRSAFCTAFRHYTGVPLRQYIARRRIQEAQIRIRSGQELSLSQIAQAVGYEDDSTFYRNFLHITGMPPAQYRRLCKKAL